MFNSLLKWVGPKYITIIWQPTPNYKIELYLWLIENLLNAETEIHVKSSVIRISFKNYFA